MTKKWRVAILGLGHWYSAYNLAGALRERPKAELAAVAWRNGAQGGRAAGQARPREPETILPAMEDITEESFMLLCNAPKQ